MCGNHMALDVGRNDGSFIDLAWLKVIERRLQFLCRGHDTQFKDFYDHNGWLNLRTVLRESIFARSNITLSDVQRVVAYTDNDANGRNRRLQIRQKPGTDQWEIRAVRGHREGVVTRESLLQEAEKWGYEGWKEHQLPEYVYHATDGTLIPGILAGGLFCSGMPGGRHGLQAAASRYHVSNGWVEGGGRGTAW